MDVKTPKTPSDQKRTRGAEEAGLTPDRTRDQPKTMKTYNDDERKTKNKNGFEGSISKTRSNSSSIEQNGENILLATPKKNEEPKNTGGIPEASTSNEQQTGPDTTPKNRDTPNTSPLGFQEKQKSSSPDSHDITWVSEFGEEGARKVTGMSAKRASKAAARRKAREQNEHQDEERGSISQNSDPKVQEDGNTSREVRDEMAIGASTTTIDAESKGMMPEEKIQKWASGVVQAPPASSEVQEEVPKEESSE